MDPIPQRVFKLSSTMFQLMLPTCIGFLQSIYNAELTYVLIYEASLVVLCTLLGTSLAPGQRFTVCTFLT